MKTLAKAVLIVTLLKKLLVVGACAAQVGAACGPQGGGLPPPQNPSLSMLHRVIASYWFADRYEWDVETQVTSNGNVRVEEFVVSDSAAVAPYTNPPAVGTKVSGPTMTGGNASLAANGSWAGTAAQPNLNAVVGVDSAGVGETVTFTRRWRATHNGTPGVYTTRAWAKGESPDNTPVSISSLLTLPPPAAPENPVIGGALNVSAVTANGANWNVTFTAYLEAFGNTTLSSPQFTLPLNFQATSAIVSVGDPVSLHLTGNTSYNGVGTPALLTGAGTLTPGQRDTITVVVTFSAGNQTAWTMQGIASAIGPSPNFIVTNDLSDWGTDPDPSDDGNPSGGGESNGTEFFKPISGTSPTDVVSTGAGLWVGCTVYPKGGLSSTQFTSGNGMILVDSLAQSTPTQTDTLEAWSDGTPKIIRTAAIFPHGGTWNCTLPGSPQAGGDSVDTASDPPVNVVINGVTQDFVRANFSTPQPLMGRVYRQGYASRSNGEPNDASGNPADVLTHYYNWWVDNGAKRSFIAIHNRMAWDQVSFNGASSFDATTTTIKAASFSLVARPGHTFQIRWAAKQNLATGVLTAVDLWKPGIFTHPCGANAGAGFLRTGEMLFIEITEGMDPEPIQAWHTASWYKMTEALPWTEDLIEFGNFATTGADSLKGVFQMRSLAYIEGSFNEQPVRAHWMNIRDFAHEYRTFDSGDPVCGYMEANEQYEPHYGIFKAGLAMSRVQADSIRVNHPLAFAKAMYLFESHARRQIGQSYNINYNFPGRSQTEQWGTNWPHVQHGASDSNRPGRSSQTPAPNYKPIGAYIWPLWYVTAFPFAPEAINRKKDLAYYLATNTAWRNAIVSGEARMAANTLLFLAFAYEDTDSVRYRDAASALLEDRFANEVWPTVPTSDWCATTLLCDRPWMWNMNVASARRNIYTWDEHGDTSQSAGARSAIAEYQTFFAVNGTYNASPTYPGGTYPTCTNPGPPTPFVFSPAAWGCASNCAGCGPPTCVNVPDDSFWAVVAGAAMVDYTPNQQIYKDLFRSGARYIGAGDSYLCPDEWESGALPQKIAGVLTWGWPCLRGLEGTFGQRHQYGTQPSETLFDE